MRSVELIEKLRELKLRHGVRPVPPELALLPEIGTPVEVEGVVTTPDLDLDRTLIAPRAFGPVLPVVPLLYKHDHKQIAGTIRALDYTPAGGLRIHATVTHPLAARCPAFSFAARVDDYTMHATDSWRFFARVERATLLECSLTDVPANPKAIVLRRGKASPVSLGYGMIQERVERLHARLKELALS